MTRLPSRGLPALRKLSTGSGAVAAPLARLATALYGRRQRELVAAGDPSLVRIEGVTLYVPLALALAFVDRRFDPLTIARVRQLLEPGMVAVDVGAHVGFYTLLLAGCVGCSGRVVALEPAPDNAALLTHNTEQLGAGQIEVMRVAAGESEGERELCLTASSDTHSFYRHPLATPEGAMRVPVRRLDRLLCAPPDFVKVDVEGAELEVLRGMEGLLDGVRPRTLVLEINPACLAAAGASASEVLTWLDRHGYHQRELIDEQAGKVHTGAAACAVAIAPTHPADWFANLIAQRG